MGGTASETWEGVTDLVTGGLEGSGAGLDPSSFCNDHQEMDLYDDRETTTETPQLTRFSHKQMKLPPPLEKSL